MATLTAVKKLSIATAVAFLTLNFFGMGRAEAITTFTSRDDWKAAVSGSSLFSEDFESFTQDTQFRTSTLDVGDFTLRQQGPGEGINFINVNSDITYSSTKEATMFTNYGTTTVDMVFDSPIFAWGADFLDASSGESLQLVLDTGAVFSNVDVTVNDGFFGFVLSPQERLSKVTFTSQNNTPDIFVGLLMGERFGLDNVIGAKSVPEPGSNAGLLAIGVGILSLLWRK